MPTAKKATSQKTKELVIEPLIRVIRGQKVILDFDLAAVYGVPTKGLNQAVKRNIEKFPQDFMFRLTSAEVLKVFDSGAQIEVLKEEEEGVGNRSQVVTGSQKHRDPRFFPQAFTEHGAIMGANVLNSPQAVQMSVFVVRAFVKMREVLLSNKALAKQLADLEKKLTDRLDLHETAIVDILKRIMALIDPPPLPPEPEKRPIGFHLREKDS